MALSEREQRLLDEMERNLYNSESDVVSPSTAAKMRPSYRSLVLGILLAIAGIIVLLAGVVTQLAWLGVIGFIAMLGGVLFAITPHKSTGDPQRDAPVGGAPKKAGAAASSSKQSLSDRMNERWEKRQDGQL
ncbi:DUF3040 domain-containing protein [Lysinibacter cavernae]|uniref:UPF0716 family protein affecting phage T7 exclusion n=1 Tax=Lysinibacter cavernae TaxID=1640652 RepID=A0A7X5QZW6_9MICO|nr:DUF3040 domain-containing protein [Lysinibacter cavernae]NIH53099.1 UPF0716 family protein affecting phage T7 exclusion [Lysinibacter cavernae]